MRDDPLHQIASLLGIAQETENHAIDDAVQTTSEKRAAILFLHGDKGDQQTLSSLGFPDNFFARVYDTEDLAVHASRLCSSIEAHGHNPARDWVFSHSTEELDDIFDMNFEELAQESTHTCHSKHVGKVGAASDPISVKFRNQQDFIQNAQLVRALPTFRSISLERLALACGLDYDPKYLHNAGYDAWVTLSCAWRMFVLASGPTPSYKKLADMPLLVAIDFEGGTSKATLNEAGIAILDPNDLEALDANSTEFASKIRTCHMLVAGREHCHPSVMAEKKMQIYKNDKHTDRPRWKFCLGPRPGIQKWIHKRGRYYQQLAADTETGISADRVAAWLMQKLHDVKPDAGYIASWPITMAGSRLDVPELNVKLPDSWAAFLVDHKDKNEVKNDNDAINGTGNTVDDQKNISDQKDTSDKPRKLDLQNNVNWQNNTDWQSNTDWQNNTDWHNHTDWQNTTDWQKDTDWHNTNNHHSIDNKTNVDVHENLLSWDQKWPSEQAWPLEETWPQPEAWTWEKSSSWDQPWYWEHAWPSVQPWP